MLSTPSPQPDWFDAESSESHLGSSRVDHDEDDDRSTIVADSRRGSMESSTWEGARAV